MVAVAVRSLSPQSTAVWPVLQQGISADGGSLTLSTCLCSNGRLLHRVYPNEVSWFRGYGSSTEHAHVSAVCYGRHSHGGCLRDLSGPLSWPPLHASLRAHADYDSDYNTDSGAESISKAHLLSPADADQQHILEKDASPALQLPSKGLEAKSWILMDGKDVHRVVCNLPLSQWYASHRLLEFFTKKLDPLICSFAKIRSTLMFWHEKKRNMLQEDAIFGSSTFGEWKGISSIHQWTATDLTLQHSRLKRIALDILYLVMACSLLGLVRVVEAFVATFSSNPPHFSKLLDVGNSFDFFTMAYLAYSIRKPVVGILRVDPTNLDEVIHLKAKIWDEMHKFYERQWKLVATLAIGRLLALMAQKLPSTNAMTKSAKICWNFLLALPIF